MFSCFNVLMKVLILGAKGLLGEALQKIFEDHETIVYDREELDVTDFTKLRLEITRLQPEVIISCVAWNDVDSAEAEEGRENSGGLNRARFVNCDVPRELAERSRKLGIIFVTYSTDHVFDGENPAGYREDDQPNPVNAYGRSKYCGEQAVQAVGGKSYIIRTSRLYGHKPRSPAAKLNFVLRMIELSKANKELSSVHEEPGVFTYVKDLAETTMKLILEKYPYGIYHLTNSGAVTWYECAREIFRYLNIEIKLKPAGRRDFPRPARTPKHSILQNTKFPPLRNWKDALHDFLTELDLK